MARTSAKIVALVDTGASQPAAGQLLFAKAALRALLGLLQPGDAFAILHFDRHVHRTFPSSGHLEVYGAASAAEAAASVWAIAAGEGSSGVAEAIAAGAELLRAEAAPRALVLLSAGDFSSGPDPRAALDPSLRTYAIGLGAIGLGFIGLGAGGLGSGGLGSGGLGDARLGGASLGEDGKLALRDLASATGGAYLFAPDPVGIASIYFDILELGAAGPSP